MEKDIETAKEFTRQMNRLAKLLGKNFENSIHGDEEKLQVYREYWNFLEIYELDVVRKAISECLQQDTFWPKPARLIKLCEKELSRRHQEMAKLEIIQRDMNYDSKEAYEKWLQEVDPEQFESYQANKLKVVDRKTYFKWLQETNPEFKAIQAKKLRTAKKKQNTLH